MPFPPKKDLDITKVVVDNPNNWPINVYGKPYNPEKFNADGTFAKGNGLSKGNPQIARARQIKKLLDDAMDDTTVKKILRKTVLQAAEGDPVARAFLFSYAIGKPVDVKEDGVDEDVKTGGMSIIINVVDPNNNIKPKDGMIGINIVDNSK